MEACMIQANIYMVEITVVNRLCGKLCISGKCFVWIYSILEYHLFMDECWVSSHENKNIWSSLDEFDTMVSFLLIIHWKLATQIDYSVKITPYGGILRYIIGILLLLVFLT
jgi:hypothetical protein